MNPIHIIGVSLPASSGFKSAVRNRRAVKRIFYSVSFGVPQEVSVTDVLDYFRQKNDSRIVFKYLKA